MPAAACPLGAQGGPHPTRAWDGRAAGDCAAELMAAGAVLRARPVGPELAPYRSRGQGLVEAGKGKDPGRRLCLLARVLNAETTSMFVSLHPKGHGDPRPRHLRGSVVASASSLSP